MPKNAHRGLPERGPVSGTVVGAPTRGLPTLAGPRAFAPPTDVVGEPRRTWRASRRWPARSAVGSRGKLTSPSRGGASTWTSRRSARSSPRSRGRGHASGSSAAPTAVPQGVFNTHPIVTARASGSIIEDVDGNRLIDFATGIAVLNVGHTSPEVVAAAQRQLELDTHTCFHVTANEPYIELAERLNALAPGRRAEEDDVRELRRRGRRERGQDRPQGDRAPGDRDVRPRVPRPDPARDVAHGQGHAVQAGHGAVRARDLPAAVRVPVPVAGRPRALRRGGARLRARGDAQAHRRGQHRRRDRRADPGRGRLHRPGARVPDRVSRSSAPSTASCSSPTRSRAGWAAPAAGSRSRTRASCPTSSRARSRSAAACRSAPSPAAPTSWTPCTSAVSAARTAGNPVAAAAALAVLDQIEREGLLERSRTLGEQVLGRLREMQDRHEVIGDVRGRGMMTAIELVADRETKEPLAGADGNAIVQRCLEEGVVILKAGTYDNVIRLLPPLTIDEDLLEEGLGILDEAIGAVAGSRLRPSASRPTTGDRPANRPDGPDPARSCADRRGRPTHRGRRHAAPRLARLPAAVARAAGVDLRLAVHDRRDLRPGLPPDRVDGRGRAARAGRVRRARRRGRWPAARSWTRSTAARS